MQSFEIKTKIEFGQGSLEYLKKINDKRVLVVTDPFMVKSGAIDKITENLINVEYTVFSEIVPDPPIELIVKGIAEINKFKPDILIALGGGSAIDATKAIMDFSKKIIHIESLEFIAIPTTSGTGSEVTSFAVITDKQKGIKYPLVSNDLLPNVAILDPSLVQTVPDFITADTGMDVLTHALEAYVSNKASDFSDALAEKAIRLVFENLVKAYKNGSDLKAREKMHNASCLAGLAFNEASLGINHSIAHILGGKFHIPHGRANSILLPYIIEYNSNIIGYSSVEYTRAAKKYAEIAKILGLEGSSIRISVRNLVNAIKKMQKAMNMVIALKECKVDMIELEKLKNEIAEVALKDACTITNPRVPTKGDILEILEEIK
ncbi:1-propanol dehydrogenase PduQ [Clostridium tarantellae]|uniref:Iron-containing alcohol dehydrogenase n=1 Tax=Clostridium tarantellae TaxID=39493 RepID=A0A6I1MPV7_9CLOT|nr:1-propanol dehydrogenase PduQ [Clostridium tarantellae]MPQ42911.1 iron-containing alcohol dehydrogenase [Clostridium tarantellae]